MASYQFSSILREQEIFFEDKLFLWIWHADKIPPHVGTSLDLAYFSLKVSGKDEGLSSVKTFALADSKKIPLVLVELDFPLTINALHSEYAKYKNAKVGTSTCLTPISNVMDRPNASQLSDLLQRCEDNIVQVYGFNLPEDYTGLKDYAVCDIQHRLQLLTDAER